MLDILTNPDLRLFSTLLFIVGGLLLLEIALMMLGITSQLGEGDVGLDVDADVDLGADGMAALDGVDAADMVDIEPVGIESFDSLDAADGMDAMDNFDAISEAQTASVSPAGLLDLLGITKVPSAVWLAGLLTFISALGFMVQGLVNTIGLGFLPSMLVLAIVFVPALFITARFAGFVGGLIPGIETSAIGAHAFHKRRGVVSGGTARKGRAAEVRWVDGYGNSHYLMAEPLDASDTISQGTQVLILRTRDKQARIISLG